MKFTGFTTSDFYFTKPFPKSNLYSARRHLKLFLECLKEELPAELQSFNYTQKRTTCLGLFVRKRGFPKVDTLQILDFPVLDAWFENVNIAQKIRNKIEKEKRANLKIYFKNYKTTILDCI